MAKTRPGMNKNLVEKESFKGPKHGSIQKKKNQKFKNTPTGKVALINGSKTQQINKNNQQKQFQKGNSASPQKVSKGSPQGKNSDKSKKQPSPKGSPIVPNQKKWDLVPKEGDSESEDDYNEGIVPQEEHSFVGDDDDDSESGSEDDHVDILGSSLAEDTDDDDDDFEDTISDEDAVVENKGVKMFKGVNTKKNKNAANSVSVSDTSSSKSEEQSSNEEEDDAEDESEDEEGAPGLKALLGNSLVDDEDDEDFDEDKVDEDDDDDDEEEGEEDDSDDDDDDDKETEDVDDDDDDVSDDDDEGNTTLDSTLESIKDSPQKGIKSPEQLEINKRTIFIGNLPSTIKKPQLEKLFKKYGPIESLRTRGIVPETENMSIKVAAKTNKLHPKVKVVHAYIKYKEEKSAIDALSMNGHVFEGNYLRVDRVIQTDASKRDPKKSVFVGNLPFKIEYNDFWNHFKGCGDIEFARIVRDRKTGVGKGIGYVNFKTADAATLALELHETELLKSTIRVLPYVVGGSKKSTTNSNKRTKKNQNGSSPKIHKGNADADVVRATKNSKNAERRMIEKTEKLQGKGGSPQATSIFQGRKADTKKNKKGNKLENRKKVMAAKLMSKPKKPTK